MREIRTVCGGKKDSHRSGFKGRGSIANKPGIRTNREGIYWYKQSVGIGKPWAGRVILKK